MGDCPPPGYGRGFFVLTLPTIITTHTLTMANPAKDKGDRAELEAASILTDLLNCPVRRKLGAGRQDDTGDLDGVPSHVVQIANWADTAAAARIKPKEAEQQRINANEQHAATLVRFRNKQWRVVLTLEQWARYLQHANLIDT